VERQRLSLNLAGGKGNHREAQNKKNRGGRGTKSDQCADSKGNLGGGGRGAKEPSWTLIGKRSRQGETEGGRRGPGTRWGLF